MTIDNNNDPKLMLTESDDRGFEPIKPFVSTLYHSIVSFHSYNKHEATEKDEYICDSCNA